MDNDTNTNMREVLFTLATEDPFRFRFLMEDQPALSEASKCAVFEAALAYQDATDTVRSTALSIAQDMERVVRHLDEGYHVNSLGEVQGRGLDLDRACALREAHARRLVQALHYALKEVEA